MEKLGWLREQINNERKWRQRDLIDPPRPTTPPGWCTGTLWPRHQHWQRPNSGSVVQKPRQVFGAPFAPAPERDILPRRKVFPALNAQSHLDYQRPATAFILNGRRSAFGKYQDKETNYRESVFEMWNVRGQKKPACFRP